MAVVGIVSGCLRDEPSVSWQPLASLTQADDLAYPSFLRDAKTAAAYRQAGLAARQQGQFFEAIAAFKTASALAPDHVPGHVLLGWTQHLAGEGAAAVTTLGQALSLDEAHVPALNALGIVHLVQGELEQAIATHRQAKALKPDNEIAYYNLALAYQRLPDMAAAIAHAQRATELEPYNPHPWVALALAHDSSQSREAAQAAYRAALQLDARYVDAAHLDHLSRAGFSAAQIKQVDDIRRTLR